MPRKEQEKGNVGGTGGHSFANVTHALKGMDFPAKKRQILEKAKQNHAPREALEEIEQLDDREFGSMADVMKGYGKHH